MINLLPPIEKEAFKKEENRQLVFIWGVFALFFLTALSLVLLSVNIYLTGQVQGYNILVGFEQRKSATMQSQNTEKEINTINQKLTELSAFYQEQPRITSLFQKISETSPEGISLSSLSLNPKKDKNNSFQVSLTGHSESRERLLEFKKNLESDSAFQGVYFPPSNWVKPSNINFSASFEITYESQ